MEPFSALALAGNIAQFVDFGCRILKTGYESYRDISGASEENVEIEKLTEGLLEFQKTLLAPSSRPTSGTDDNNQIALQELATRCCDVADTLLQLLRGLKVEGKGLVRTWNSLRQACRSQWHADDIAKLEKSMDNINEQINSRLIYMVWYGFERHSMLY